MTVLYVRYRSLLRKLSLSKTKVIFHRSSIRLQMEDPLTYNCVWAIGACLWLGNRLAHDTLLTDYSAADPHSHSFNLFLRPQVLPFQPQIWERTSLQITFSIYSMKDDLGESRGQRNGSCILKVRQEWRTYEAVFLDLTETCHWVQLFLLRI